MLKWILVAVADRQVKLQLADSHRLFSDEQAAHEATRRKLRVAEAEIESLAAVIARDRQRVAAETAAFARQQAEHEGMRNGRS